MEEKDTALPMTKKPEATEVVLRFAAMSPQEQRDAMMFMSGVQVGQSILPVVLPRPSP